MVVHFLVNLIQQIQGLLGELILVLIFFTGISNEGIKVFLALLILVGMQSVDGLLESLRQISGLNIQDGANITVECFHFKILM